MWGIMINHLHSKTDILNNFNETTDCDAFAALMDDYGKPERLDSMTNKTYKVDIDGISAVMRLPGIGTSDMIDRTSEGHIFTELIRNQFRMMPDILYHDSKTGICISAYLSGYRNFDPANPGDRKKIALALKSLHAIASTSEDSASADSAPAHSSSVHSTSVASASADTNQSAHNSTLVVSDLLLDIHKYRNMSAKKESFYISDKTRTLMHNYIKHNQHQDLVLCHRDMMYNNLLINDTLDCIKLIDWEYSGLLNRRWDLGCLLSESMLHFNAKLSDIESALVTFYFTDSPLTYIQEELMIWSAIVDYVWAEWSLAKTAVGEDCIEYGKKRMENCEAFVQILEKRGFIKEYV